MFWKALRRRIRAGCRFPFSHFGGSHATKKGSGCPAQELRQHSRCHNVINPAVIDHRATYRGRPSEGIDHEERRKAKDHPPTARQDPGEVEEILWVFHEEANMRRSGVLGKLAVSDTDGGDCKDHEKPGQDREDMLGATSKRFAQQPDPRPEQHGQAKEARVPPHGVLMPARARSEIWAAVIQMSMKQAAPGGKRNPRHVQGDFRRLSTSFGAAVAPGLAGGATSCAAACCCPCLWAGVAPTTAWV